MTENEKDDLRMMLVGWHATYGVTAAKMADGLVDMLKKQGYEIVKVRKRKKVNP